MFLIREIKEAILTVLKDNNSCHRLFSLKYITLYRAVKGLLQGETRYGLLSTVKEDYFKYSLDKLREENTISFDEDYDFVYIIPDNEKKKNLPNSSNVENSRSTGIFIMDTKSM